MKAFLRKLVNLIIRKSFLLPEIENIKINQGKIISNELFLSNLSNNIQNYEFKIFSQWGEDGIIQHLTKHVEIKNKTFIEFGVENFNESNCRFLMMNNNWSGFVVDSSQKNINELQKSYYYWKYDLNSCCAFIDKDNVEDVIKKSGFPSDLGILSIDIDGNDYYVLEKINIFKPRILIVEFNSNFPPSLPVSIPYEKNFNRTKSCKYNIFWGASLKAINHLANSKGYKFIGTNSSSCNAFFVRKDLVPGHLNNVKITDFYDDSKHRESRDSENSLTYLNSKERRNLLKGKEVYDVVNKKIIKL